MTCALLLSQRRSKRLLSSKLSQSLAPFAFSKVIEENMVLEHSSIVFFPEYKINLFIYYKPKRQEQSSSKRFARLELLFCYFISWHQTIFPGSPPPSIVVPALFNCQVRDGLALVQSSLDTRIGTREIEYFINLPCSYYTFFLSIPGTDRALLL